MMIFKWIIKETDKKNIRSFLANHDFSNSQISKLKNRGGRIFVNKKQRYLSYDMPAGATLVVVMPSEVSSEKIVPIAGKIDIVYEDEFYIIVNKPAGLASLPARGKATATMANYVKDYLQKQNQSDAIHTVTRLDKDTSGLMIFAKNSYAHSQIGGTLHNEDFLKSYIAIAINKFDKNAGMIDLPIGVSDDFYMKRVIDYKHGKASQTKYQVLENFDNGAICQVTLLSGRTHQIRVHFKAIGHPLFGDSLYNENPTDLIERQALHCERLKFVHPINKEIIDVKASIPRDMENLMQKLRT
ncbi:RluA family pseudouridine synthase [Lactobacillus sp. YT155]|uniref:RluA family pseudouridine synthase n=1 Tax=Lactobacillus sp. YT155 TaxID=3060955 RepID=UPI00265D8DF1|nr:RluA family pseudouridine synthase [Lactobacillus sp. YT155]MDO1605154.1 RluA family pseudouridine synthase [Lactobacillus sp. YT155]